jgi:hypothetical protein
MATQAILNIERAGRVTSVPDVFGGRLKKALLKLDIVNVDPFLRRINGIDPDQLQGKNPELIGYALRFDQIFKDSQREITPSNFRDLAEGVELPLNQQNGVLRYLIWLRIQEGGGASMEIEGFPSNWFTSWTPSKLLHRREIIPLTEEE